MLELLLLFLGRRGGVAFTSNQNLGLTLPTVHYNFNLREWGGLRKIKLQNETKRGGSIFPPRHNGKPCSVTGLHRLGGGVRGPHRTAL